MVVFGMDTVVDMDNSLNPNRDTGLQRSRETRNETDDNNENFEDLVGP